MNKICFLIPTHLPRFENAYKFMRSFIDCELNKQADLCFVFSSYNDEIAFLARYGGEFRSIVLENELKNLSDGIINIKKLYSLWLLQKDYEYIIILDDESVIIKNINLMKMCKEFQKNKLLYGNQTQADWSGIYQESVKFFDKKPPQELYFWFNQLCIYPCQFLEDFFDKSGLDNDFARNDFSKISYCSFDYMVFGFYLIAYQKFKILDLECLADWGAIEHNTIAPYSKKVFSIKFYHSNPNSLHIKNRNSVFCLIHLDRMHNFGYIQSNIATQIIKYQLSYKLGQAMIENSKSIFGYVKMPFKLYSIKKEHINEQKSYEKIIKQHPNLKLAPLESYPDYNEAIKIKNDLSYKLGEALIKANNIGFISGGGIWLLFEIRRIIKEFKKAKK
ncbi:MULTISPECIES: hypothetical protein [Campylobacter]|uniref:hypothetical protein n=1 Tax=Campylobacter TaxID=194 RepID=UPI000A333609|nr:hypothetical protein [Campylobacter sp. P0124]MCR8696650.1 hypothetical protein [Campylobacter sp. RM19073]MEE3705267.1 hypothetical protein [Campylobacter sp. CX2-8023-23]